MTPDSPRRAAAYVRISRDRAGAGLGVERQEADCRALAERLGVTITEVHSDNDISASGGRPRPGYRALLDSIRAGRVDVLLAWHVDRLTRRPAELEQLIDAVERAGVTVATVTAGDLDLSTPSGRMVARLLGTVARHEIEHAVERMRRAKEQAAADGRWRGGARPFGYGPDGTTVVEHEAAVVRDATARALAGESLRGLAAELNANGVVTSTGASWTPSRLRQLLLRGRNAGLVVRKDGEIVGPARWPALVDEAQWRNLRRVLLDPARRTVESSSPTHLGSGLYACAVCRTPVISARNNGRRAYSCPSFHVTRHADPVDELVTRLVLGRLQRPDARGLLVHDSRRVDAAALRARREDVEGQLNDLAALFAEGDITAGQLREGSRRLRAEADRLDGEVAACSETSPLTGIADAPDPGAAWSAAPVSRRKAVVRELMSVSLLTASRGRPKGWKAGQGGGYFDPDSVSITWRVPT